MEKLAIFGPKPWVNPFEKNVNFSSFELFCFFFFNIERLFLVLEYRKRHYPGPYCIKKKVGNMLIFGQKTWVNPFGKMAIFILFEIIVFKA